MNKRFKDTCEPCVSGTPALIIPMNKQELKTIKVAVRRKDIPEPNITGPLQRNLEDPEELVVHTRPGNKIKKLGEGHRPLFDRDDVVVNQDFETRIVVSSPAHSPERNIPFAHSQVQFVEGRYRAKSTSSVCSKCSSCSSSKNYPGQKRYSRKRSRSLSRSKSSQRKGYPVYKDVGTSYRDDKYARRDSRNTKDELKQSERRRSRSYSPRYSRRKTPEKQDTRASSDINKYKSGGSSYSKETKHGEYINVGRNKVDYRRSISRERRRSRSARRSASPEKLRDHSKSYRFKSPSRRSRSPHREEAYRDRSYAESKAYRHSPSPRRYEGSSKGSAVSDKYRRRSRSPSHYRLESSHHRSSTSRRSPHKSEGYRGPSRYDRRSRSPQHRRHSRSPNRRESHRSRSPHKEHSRHYSRSPFRGERRYRSSPDRSRRRTPSPYRRSDARDRYLGIPPHLPGPMGPVNYGQPWYPWPIRGPPGLIPPQGLIMRPPPPQFAPFAPLVRPPRPRQPIIYNNRTMKITPALNTNTTSSIAASTSTTSAASSSTVVGCVDSAESTVHIEEVTSNSEKVSNKSETDEV